jgi:hypothetical protein
MVVIHPIRCSYYFPGAIDEIPHFLHKPCWKFWGEDDMQQIFQRDETASSVPAAPKAAARSEATANLLPSCKLT